MTNIVLPVTVVTPTTETPTAVDAAATQNVLTAYTVNPSAFSASTFCNYRKYSDEYIDPGHSVLVILDVNAGFFAPDFFVRNTFQTWDVSNASTYSIGKWAGTTLKARTLHEIYITNNSNDDTVLTFTNNYLLVDEEEGRATQTQKTTIPKNTTAHYYCTALFEQGNLYLHLRVGSQDTRPKIIPFY